MSGDVFDALASLAGPTGATAAADAMKARRLAVLRLAIDATPTTSSGKSRDLILDTARAFFLFVEDIAHAPGSEGQVQA